MKINRNISDILDCIDGNPLETTVNHDLPTDRSLSLTMEKIGMERGRPAAKRLPRRLAFVALAAAMAVVMTGTAFAANVFGIRDLLTDLWSVNEAAETLELKIDSAWPPVGGGSFGDAKYTYTTRSMAISATGMEFSYDYTFEGGELAGTPLPHELRLAFNDGTWIGAAIEDYTDENGFVTATASFIRPVDLSKATFVMFGTPDFGQVGSEDGIVSGVRINVVPFDEQPFEEDTATGPLPDGARLFRTVTPDGAADGGAGTPEGMELYEEVTDSGTANTDSDAE